MNEQLFHEIIYSVITAGIGIGLFYLLFFLIRQWMKAKRSFVPKVFDKHFHIAGLLLFVAVVINITLNNFKPFISSSLFGYLSHFVAILLIISIGYFIIKTVNFFQDLLLNFYGHHARNDYTQRSIRTRFGLLHRIINVVIILFIIIAVLMTFPQVRQFGTALLASAGVAGIVIGFAAQKSLGSLLGGIQIAITQPIKIEDTVKVNNYLGTISEITLTYVVLNTMDEKNLIIPINFFLENTFENWTRSSPETLSKVKIKTEYSMPIDQIRAEFKRWLEETPLWDHRVARLRVTDAAEKTIELEATMSTKNAEDAFKLESYVREKMVEYLRDHSSAPAT
jgi:small-conductance mechanosensitive channel